MAILSHIYNISGMILYKPTFNFPESDRDGATRGLKVSYMYRGPLWRAPSRRNIYRTYTLVLGALDPGRHEGRHVIARMRSERGKD